MVTKPVWRMNSGNGIPNDAKIFGMVLYEDGVCTELDLEPSEYWWYLDGNSIKIAAYQTNRYKAAKYERVECDVCEGDGYIFIPVAWSADELREKCPVCNGKGYILEAK